MSYEDLLDIFTRINTYTVRLNNQEDRNARYVGYFKQIAYSLGYRYVKYFLDAKVVTKSGVSRMAEAELASDLLISICDAVQTNKSIDGFYRKYEEERGNLENAADKFDTIMSYIGEIYPGSELAETEWSRVHMFYSLFTAVGHCLYGLEKLDQNKRVRITRRSIGKVRVVLDEVIAKYDELRSLEDLSDAPVNYRKFMDWSLSRTTDSAARIGRANFISEKLKNSLR